MGTPYDKTRRSCGLERSMGRNGRERIQVFAPAAPGSALERGKAAPSLDEAARFDESTRRLGVRTVMAVTASVAARWRRGREEVLDRDTVRAGRLYLHGLHSPPEMTLPAPRCEQWKEDTTEDKKCPRPIEGAGGKPTSSLFVTASGKSGRGTRPTPCDTTRGENGWHVFTVRFL